MATRIRLGEEVRWEEWDRSVGFRVFLGDTYIGAFMWWTAPGSTAHRRWGNGFVAPTPPLLVLWHNIEDDTIAYLERD